MRNKRGISFAVKELPHRKQTPFVFWTITFILFGVVPLLNKAHAEDFLSICKQAMQGDAEYQAAIHAHEASREIKKQARSNLFPTLAANAEYVQTNQDIISSDNSVYATGKTDFETTAYNLTLSQPVFNWASIVRLRQADAETFQADAELEAVRQELVLRVADQYFATLAAQDVNESVRAEKAALAKLYELASEKFKSGFAAITDLHDAKARYALVEANLLESENDLRDAFEKLQEIIGKPVDSVSPLKKEIPLVNPDPDDVEHWSNAALEQNIRLTLENHRVEVAGLEISRQQAGHYPTVDLVGRHNNQETQGTLFGGGSEVATEDILLRLNVPLFQGWYVVSRTREAQALKRQSLQNKEKIRRKVMQETRSAFLKVKTLIKKVEALNESLKSQSTTLDLKREGFKSGRFASIDVLGAEQNLWIAIRELAVARYGYIVTTLKLKQVTGTLSEEDIIKVNGMLE